MPKETTGYYLESQNVRWLSEEAKKRQRSASWLLNDILTRVKKEGLPDDSRTTD